MEINEKTAVIALFSVPLMLLTAVAIRNAVKPPPAIKTNIPVIHSESRDDETEESVAALVYAILDRKQNSADRIKAVDKLSEIPTDEAFNALVDCLKVNHVSVQRKIIQALAWRKDPRAIVPLKSQLNIYNSFYWGKPLDEQSRDTAQAIIAIGFTPDDLIDLVKVYYTADRINELEILEPGIAVKLIDNLKNSNDQQVKISSIMALGLMKEKSAVIPLTDILTESDFFLQWAAVRALTMIADTRAVRPMINLINHDDHRITGTVNEFLKKMETLMLEELKKNREPSPELIESLSSAEFPEKYYAVWVLNLLADKDAADVMSKLLTDSDFRIRNMTVSFLRKISWHPKNTDDQLHFLFATEDDQGIKQLAAPDVIEALGRHLFHPNQKLAGWTIRMLGDIDNRQTIPFLMQAWRSAPNINETLFTALAKKGSTAVGPLILELKNSQSKKILRQTIKLLGQAADPRAVDPLLDLMKNNQDPEFQSYIREALCFIGDPKTKDILIEELIGYPNKEAAAKGLNKIGWGPLSETERIHWWLATQNITEIQKNHDKVNKILIDDMKSGKPGAFKYAILTGQEDLVPFLLDELNSKGTLWMANIYYSSGNPDLEKAAKEWAISRGCVFVPTTSDANIRWGRLR